MERKNTTSLWTLYSAFFRIGAFTFGGGYAMLPMLEKECVEKHDWATEEQLLNYFAIGQCTPGVIAVNTATFVGTGERGLRGGIAATLGVISPSILIIVLIAALLSNFAHIPAVQHAFGGIRVAVGVLILNAVIKLYRNNVKNKLGLCLCLCAFLLVAVFSLSPVFVVLGAALVGLKFKLGEEKKA